MNLQTISVIIPTHNNGVELRKAVLSILAQEEKSLNKYSLEIIIINDASDHEYEDRLKQLAIDFPVCTLLNMESQLGPAGARNAGIRAAKGELISFLDADDEWPNDKLRILMPYFSSPKIEVAGGKIKYILKAGQSPVNMNFEDEAQRITHVHLGALLVRKSVFDKDLYFDETLTFSEDVDWWYRLREHKIGIVISEATTLLYHVHGDNMSVNKSIEELQLLRILHKSVKRRENKLLNQHLPQIKDFRIDQEDPLISIVIPLYNGKNLIKKTLESVLDQTYTSWELIIVDDGSSDGGAEYIATFCPQATIIIQKNAGVAAARNIGVKHSRGEVIAFLDQDDQWMPSKLRDQWDIFREDPYCGFVTCNQLLTCEKGVTLPAHFSEKLLEEHRAFVPSALLVRKRAILNVNGFDESLEVSSDFDLILKLRKAHYIEKNVEKLLLKRWFHGNNASLNKSLLRNEILSLLRKQIKQR